MHYFDNNYLSSTAINLIIQGTTHIACLIYILDISDPKFYLLVPFKFHFVIFQAFFKDRPLVLKFEFVNLLQLSNPT